ncbi:MAG: site-specific integrase [Burkholderiales bacterium]|nr:MAG: site-specific integrase [Burkholderiales bacterium]
MALTEAQVRAAKHATGPDKYTSVQDVPGLFLMISSTGKKHWRARFRASNQSIKQKLGDYPKLSLAAARAALSKLREQHQTLSPIAAVGTITFEAAFHEWLEHWSPGKSARTVFYGQRRVKANMLPYLGNRPLASLLAKDFVDIALRMEKEGRPEVASRTLTLCKQILTRAVIVGAVERNELAGITDRQVFRVRKETNYARLTIDQFPGFLRKIDGYDGSARIRTALYLLAYTFVRPGELLQATWAQCDLEHALWSIPKEVMKQRRPHVVPLAPQVVDLLSRLREANLQRFGSTGADPARYLLPGDRDPARMMSHNALLNAIDTLGYKGAMTSHGFRGVASTALNETGRFREDVIEAQLAHVQGKVRGAYNHASYLKDRREMMRFWADQIDQMRTNGHASAELLPGARLKRELAEE